MCRGPHLVVAPASLLENWERELALWCPRLRVVTYHGAHKEMVRNQLEKWRYDVSGGGGGKPTDVLNPNVFRALGRPVVWSEACRTSVLPAARARQLVSQSLSACPPVCASQHWRPCVSDVLVFSWSQVAAELEKGTLKEPPAGWIRPGDAAEGAGGDESGSSGVQGCVLGGCVLRLKSCQYFCRTLAVLRGGGAEGF
jgi:hypothetical protein